MWWISAVLELKVWRIYFSLGTSLPTRYMMPAAVSQTEIKMDMSWASLEKGKLRNFWCWRWVGQALEKGNFMIMQIFHLMEVEVFSMLRYCRMSGTDIKRRARRKPKPEKQEKKRCSKFLHRSPIHVLSRYMETKDCGMVKKSTKESSSNINQNLSEAAIN